MKSGRIIYRDHAVAASGHGGDCYCGKEEGISDIAALAAGAIAAFLIYQAITMAAGRRRKRDDGKLLSPIEVAKDVFFTGNLDKTCSPIETTSNDSHCH